MQKHEIEYPRLVICEEITEENFEALSEIYHCSVGEWILQFELNSDGKEPEGGAVIWRRKPTDEEIAEIIKSLE